MNKSLRTRFASRSNAPVPGTTHRGNAIFWLWTLALYLAILYFAVRSGAAHPAPNDPGWGAE